MSTISDLTAAWTVIILTIADPLRKAEAYRLLERYVAAEAKLAEAEASGLQSYSATGRTVTRRAVNEMRQSVDRLRQGLATACYGNTTLYDGSI